MLDLAINNGLLVDTRHRRRLSLNLGIQGGKVACLSTQPLEAARCIDASGQTVSPGFVDVHGHVDGYHYSGELSACQGITTSIGGNCGLSPVEMGLFFDSQEKNGFCIHQAQLVGHSFSLRQAVGLEDPYRPASPQQLDQMLRLAATALEEGACGVSLGLDYSPGASAQELSAMAQLCARYGRVLPVHTRVTTRNDLNSIYEVLAVAKRTGVRLLLSHFVFQYGTGMVSEALEIVETARAKGIDVWIDSGMYTDWTTFIGTATFDENSLTDNDMVLGEMVVATGRYTGRRLDRALYTHLRQHTPQDSVIVYEGREEEIYRALRPSWSMPSTDIGTYQRGEGHPQIAGSFPRYLHRMVVERQELSLEEALYKATLLPAQLFGLPGKGVLEPGMDADVVIFDPQHIRDTAQMPDVGRPDARPVGIQAVIVGGTPVVEHNQFYNLAAGHTIRL